MGFTKPLLVCVFIVGCLVVISGVFCFLNHYSYLSRDNVSYIHGRQQIGDGEPFTGMPNGFIKFGENTKKIKKDFIDNGIIDGKYKFKQSIYFLFNQRGFDKKTLELITSNTKNNIDSRLVIVSGFACDLGDEQYNKRLIQDRINSVVDVIKKINPSLDILVANNGKTASLANIQNAKERADKRTKERRVDIYFY